MAMTLTCPGCDAKYTITDERLHGRRVKVRCKRCGAMFPARARDADLFAGLATAGGESDAPGAAGETRHGTDVSDATSVLRSNGSS